MGSTILLCFDRKHWADGQPTSTGLTVRDAPTESKQLFHWIIGRGSVSEQCVGYRSLTSSTCMGTSIEEEGGMETEIAKRVGAGWMNWKKCSGVLCDKRMPVKLKGKVYRTVVRPAMLYGAETWSEMRMLRWMCGVTRKDKIRNEHIRGTTKVVQVSRKITERRLKWYGHVMRMEEDHVVRRVMTKAIPGKSKRGRTKDKVEGCVQEGHADCRIERGR